MASPKEGPSATWVDIISVQVLGGETETNDSLLYGKPVKIFKNRRKVVEAYAKIWNSFTQSETYSKSVKETSYITRGEVTIVRIRHWQIPAFAQPCPIIVSSPRWKKLNRSCYIVYLGFIPGRKLLNDLWSTQNKKTVHLMDLCHWPRKVMVRFKNTASFALSLCFSFII